MSPDWSQYEDREKVEFNYRAVCIDCGWEDRRRTEECAQNSKSGHTRYDTGHRVRINELDDDEAYADLPTE